MELIKIVNSNDAVLPGLNFTMREFYSPRYPKPPIGHEFNLPKCLPLALQVIRDHYREKYKNLTWIVTCTLRHGNDDFSSHKNCVDSIPGSNVVEVMADIQKNFISWENSELVHKILTTGTNVMIIENGCLHLGWRTNKLDHHKGYPIEDFYIGFWQPSKVNIYGTNISYSH